jgi:hypothetical protein
MGLLRSSGRVGFYGCADATGSRLVRVAWAGEDRPPRAPVLLDCPVCGSKHLAEVAWRKASKRDEGREPEIVLEPEPDG